ncbi:MAG: phosphate ABC transporter substrate-binding protein [Desulfobacterales bacterium]|nr:phosphate ABC transporter substrate-binding protein [Desulfobacterales bacterium]
MKLIRVCLIGILLNIGFSTVAFADLAIVVHPSNDNTLIISQLRKIYLGKSLTFPDGSHVIPIDTTSEESFKFFLKNVLQKNEAGLHSYWSRMLFSGKGKPPKEVNSSADVLEIITKNKSAIGYVEVDKIDSRVKVILMID